MKRGSRKRSGSNVPDGLPRDVEEHGEDLAALEEADGEEIRMGDLQQKDIAELNIGHSIIARAVLVGLERAVREMVALVR